MKNILCCCAVLSSTALVPFVHADDSAAADKSQYNLFNPTPQELMRSWSTDNAGRTAYTIDAGHFEADVTAFEYGFFQRDNWGREGVQLTSREFSFGSTEIKAGLLNNVDAEVLITPYTVRTDNYNVSGTANYFYRRTGVDDLESRIKWNLWGNDGGPTALSVGGLVYYPTGTGNISNERFVGGFLMDFTAQLPWDFELRTHHNAISSVDYPQNSSTLKRDYSFQNELSVLHPIVGNLKGYVLFNTYVLTSAGTDWQGSIGTGLNYRFMENVELFAGVDFGVHGTPADYSPFIGISARF